MNFIIFLSLPFFLYAIEIVNYNIYDRTNRVDVMLSFNAPYNDEIVEKKTDNLLVVTLKNVLIKNKGRKHLDNKFLTFIDLKNNATDSKIYCSIKNDTQLNVSRTIDKYGLRLRFSFNKEKKKNTNIFNTNQDQSLQTLLNKKNEIGFNQYLIVILFILFGIGLMLFFKTKSKQIGMPNNKNWLFDKKDDLPTYNFNIKFEKPIDKTHRIALLEFNNNFYLVILGTSVTLLDKYDNNLQPKNNDDFQELLKENQKMLDDFMQLKTSQQEQNGLESYKEKASLL
jgi:hypothetical protein